MDHLKNIVDEYQRGKPHAQEREQWESRVHKDYIDYEQDLEEKLKYPQETINRIAESVHMKLQRDHPAETMPPLDEFVKTLQDFVDHNGRPVPHHMNILDTCQRLRKLRDDLPDLNKLVVPVATRTITASMSIGQTFENPDAFLLCYSPVTFVLSDMVASLVTSVFVQDSHVFPQFDPENLEEGQKQAIDFFVQQFRRLIHKEPPELGGFQRWSHDRRVQVDMGQQIADFLVLHELVHMRNSAHEATALQEANHETLSETERAEKARRTNHVIELYADRGATVFGFDIWQGYLNPMPTAVPLFLRFADLLAARINHARADQASDTHPSVTMRIQEIQMRFKDACDQYGHPELLSRLFNLTVAQSMVLFNLVCRKLL